MEFIQIDSLGSGSPQAEVWSALKRAFEVEDGFAVFRPAIPTGSRGKAPDIALFHPQLGMCVLECAPFRTGDVREVVGDDWYLTSREDPVRPTRAASNQMFAVEGRYREAEETRGALAFRWALCLPMISHAEWEERNLRPVLEQGVLLKDDFRPSVLKGALGTVSQSGPQGALGPEVYRRARGMLLGEVVRPEPRPVPPRAPQDSPVRVIAAIERGFASLDADQAALAYQAPDGLQRLRGLAGTGKTVVLARRLARMHELHPDWDLAFLFWTQSLYGQVTALVESAFRQQVGSEPNWSKLRILHAWGGQSREGFCSLLARQAGRRLLPLGVAGWQCGSGDPRAMFGAVCSDLGSKLKAAPQLFDAAVIDEGQDLPPEFYRLVHASLREPKRLALAYDEAQGIGSQEVPRWEDLFGQAASIGQAHGFAEGGIQRSLVFRRCYRTPQQLLLVAQAVNMGLYRPAGPVQGITRAATWRTLGYEVEGQFRPGQDVTLRRCPETNVHPLDTDEALAQGAGPVLSLHEFRDEDEELTWIANQVKADVDRGLRPEDILITCLRGNNESSYFNRMGHRLKRHHIQVSRPDKDGSSVFARPGHVSLVGVFRAKGNEAWKVYAARMQQARQPNVERGESEVVKRNEAYVALTRARAWCVATGIADPVFEEMRHAMRLYPELRFQGFDRATLQRTHEDVEEETDPAKQGHTAGVEM